MTADGDARVIRENDTEAKGIIEGEKNVQRYLHYPKNAYIIHGTDLKKFVTKAEKQGDSQSASFLA